MAQLLVDDLPIMYIGAMSTVFKINGDTVSREEWESLRENLPTNLKTWLACRDNTLTEEELNQILMIPAGDRWLTSFDNFKNWKPSRFDNVADILLRHGYYDLNVFETHTVSSLVNAGIRVLEELGNDVWQNSVWQRIRDRYDWASLLPQEYLQTYAGWKEGLKKLYNIEFIKRFGSFETLYSVLILRCRLRDFSRPFAVVIQPKSDWNEAFEQPRLLVEELKHLGYQIFYYEAATEEEVQRNLAEATQNGTDKADLIVLSGHGMATSLKLSGIYSWEGGSMNDENLYICYHRIL